MTETINNPVTAINTPEMECYDNGHRAGTRAAMNGEEGPDGATTFFGLGYYHGYSDTRSRLDGEANRAYAEGVADAMVGHYENHYADKSDHEHRAYSHGYEEMIATRRKPIMRSELQVWLEEPESRWETIDVDDTDDLDADTQLGAWLDRTEEPGAYRCLC